MASKEQLDRILEENKGKPFFIQKNLGKIKSRWLLYPSMEYEDIKTEIRALDHKKVTTKVWKKSTLTYEDINQVQIIPSWIIIDIDPPKTTIERDRDKASQQQMEIISQRLQADKISHTTFHTGNTGRHIKIVFEELEHLEPYERQWMKRSIIKKYSEKCNADLMKTGQKTLIQLEDTPHRKTFKNKIQLQSYLYGNNKIPPDLVEALHLRRVGSKLKSFASPKGCIPSPTTTNLLPACVSFLEQEHIREGYRENVLFILRKYWIKHYDKDYAKMKAAEFIELHDNFIDKNMMENQIERDQSNGQIPRCKYIKNVMNDLGFEKVCEGCKEKI